MDSVVLSVQFQINDHISLFISTARTQDADFKGHALRAHNLYVIVCALMLVPFHIYTLAFSSPPHILMCVHYSIIFYAP